MNFLKAQFSPSEDEPKQPFRRPTAPGMAESRSAAAQARSVKFSNLELPSSSTIPTQAGCSTLKPGGYRNKVKLKPGHSALDWNDLVTKTGTSKGLVTGIDRLLNEDRKALAAINNPHSLIQLSNGVPTYLIKPPLRINDEILKKHNTISDCWGIINGKVYSMTHYFDFHPGGVDILFKHCAGKDGTRAFNQYHRWVSVDKLLETSLVGVYAA